MLTRFVSIIHNETQFLLKIVALIPKLRLVVVTRYSTICFNGLTIFVTHNSHQNVVHSTNSDKYTLATQITPLVSTPHSALVNVTLWFKAIGAFDVILSRSAFSRVMSNIVQERVKVVYFI